MSEEKSLVQQVGGLVQPDNRSMIEVQSARAIAEVQGAMTIAKKFPRDEKVAYGRIMAACKRKALAEVAIYEYPRGGEKVTGPSIRLAEAMAQGWGNLDTGVVELERRDGESTAMAYCVDLETNYRKTVVFSVPHVRDTKQGQKQLKETRDIYETVMNQGSRRLRNCIMAVIPGDIVDEALSVCESTLRSDKEPLQDRIRKMMASFAELGVTREMIEAKFGCKTEALSENQMVRLRAAFQSIKDGVGMVKDHFDVTPPSTAAELNKLTGSTPAGQGPAPAEAAKGTPAAPAPQPAAPAAKPAAGKMAPEPEPQWEAGPGQGLFGGKEDPRNVK